MEKIEQKIALIKIRLTELLARKESESIRLELFWIAREIDALLGPSDVPDVPSPPGREPRVERSSVPSTFTRTDRNLILLVDEDADLRAYLRSQLGRDFDVTEASNGGDAWDMAVTLNPDVIISGMLLPVISGDELCRKLHGSVETSHIAVILLSSLSERENIIYGLEAGADDYITKPFDIDILRTRINNQLDKEFMNRVFRIIESQIANSDFAINDLCYELAMSRSSVYNKIKTLTGRGPNDIIRIVRLSRAKELLSRRPYPINEVATMVGFADPKYFSTCFKKEYGISPSKIGDEWSETAGFSS